MIAVMKRNCYSSQSSRTVYDTQILEGEGEVSQRWSIKFDAQTLTHSGFPQVFYKLFHAIKYCGLEQEYTWVLANTWKSVLQRRIHNHLFSLYIVSKSKNTTYVPCCLCKYVVRQKILTDMFPSSIFKKSSVSFVFVKTKWCCFYPVRVYRCDQWRCVCACVTMCVGVCVCVLVRAGKKEREK